MVPYASQTGTRKNLEALRSEGWRLLLSASARRNGGWEPHGFGYAIDNGAWSCHRGGRPFDADAFRELVALRGRGADWIVLPDIVAGGLRSLDFSLSWLPFLDRDPFRLLLAVQDGIEPPDVRGLLGRRIGVFLGGSTAWKLTTMALWGAVAREAGAHYHVARVNTLRRARLAKAAGAHSVDGSGASRFRGSIPLVTWACRETLSPAGWGRNRV